MLHFLPPPPPVVHLPHTAFSNTHRHKYSAMQCAWAAVACLAVDKRCTDGRRVEQRRWFIISSVVRCNFYCDFYKRTRRHKGSLEHCACAPQASAFISIFEFILQLNSDLHSAKSMNPISIHFPRPCRAKGATASDSYQPHNPPAINLIAINDTSNARPPRIYSNNNNSHNLW